MAKTYRLGFLGGGNMAEALIKGLSKSFPIYLSDPSTKRLAYLVQTYGIKRTKSNKETVEKSDFIIIAVKPDVVNTVLEEIKSVATSSKVLMSIAAGISTSHINLILKKDIYVMRAMPNTPALIGQGMSVIVFDEKIPEQYRMFAKKIFSTVGRVLELQEQYLDAVTALSGSGPAYVFLLIEAMADGGVKMGLSREVSLELAAQTVLGATAMVIQTNKHPATLKDMVTSPGGTTIEGVHILEQMGVRGAIISAIEAGTMKAEELSRKRKE